jgi:hypothetical protein
MPTYRDFEMLNSSLDRVGDSLLRNRMIEEQKRERETARGDRAAERAEDRTVRDRQFGLEERRVKASEQSAAASDEMRKLLLQDRKAQEAISQVRGQIDQIMSLHRSGQLSTADANARISQLKQKIEQGTSLILKESGLADFQLQDIPEKEKGESKTATIMDFEKMRGLKQAVVDARAKGDPASLAAAEAELELFETMRSRGAGDSERVTEYERDPDSGELVRSRTRSEKPGAAKADKNAAPDDKKTTGKPLTLVQAQEFLKQAGGDKNKARELARQAGFTF